jgi:hypothetical protein
MIETIVDLTKALLNLNQGARVRRSRSGTSLRRDTVPDKSQPGYQYDAKHEQKNARHARAAILRLLARWNK